MGGEHGGEKFNYFNMTQKKKKKKKGKRQKPSTDTESEDQASQKPSTSQAREIIENISISCHILSSRQQICIFTVASRYI